jgi:hypothetical protein
MSGDEVNNKKITYLMPNVFKNRMNHSNLIIHFSNLCKKVSQVQGNRVKLSPSYWKYS